MAQMFVSSFSVSAYSSEDGSDSTGGTTSASVTGKIAKDKDNKSKKIIIAVVVTCGVLLLAIAGYFAFRATKRGAIALGGSPKMDFRERDMGYRGGGGHDNGLRPFQLGGGGGAEGYRGGDRDSLSSTSTASTRDSRSSPRGFGHGASTSVDHHGSDRRSSWWRFSDGSGSDGGRGAIGLAIGGDGSGPMREGPRRTRIVNPAMIGR
jgi:hypothetical protein